MQKIEKPPRVDMISAEAKTPEGKPIDIQIREDRGWMKWFELIADSMPLVNRFEQSLDVTSVAANTTSEQTFTVPGITPLDYKTPRELVFVTKPSHSTGLGIVNARISAANTLAITFMNTTAGAIDPSAETYFIVTVRI